MRVLLVDLADEALCCAVERGSPINFVCTDMEPDMIYVAFPSRNYNEVRKLRDSDAVECGDE